jgi:hypothetical protein
MSRALLVVWLIMVVVVGGALTALHVLALPDQTPAWAPPTGQWAALHALSGKCGCSRRVADHLEQRRANVDLHERVALIDPTPGQAQRLRAAGFEVDEVTASQLETKYGLTAAPTFVLRRPNGAVAYSGGYAPRGNLPARDLELVSQAQQSPAPIAPYPLFGCAVSRQLQAAVDPLNLKFGAAP